MKNNLVFSSLLLSGFLFSSINANAEFTKGKIKIPFHPEVKAQSQVITPKSKTNLIVKFNIDSGAYLYKDSISINIKPINGIKILSPILPKAEKKFDTFSNKEKEIYHNSFFVNVPIELTNNYNQNKISFSSTIGYQGCSKALCYLPQEKIFNTTINVKKK
ncbi:MAG: protein-disulfide reductase DsbD N-terminal domain-containing protein [Candidatus Sericytochromatia bacterium]